MPNKIKTKFKESADSFEARNLMFYRDITALFNGDTSFVQNKGIVEQTAIQTRLSEALHSMKMTQNELAELTDLSQSAISSYKHGEQLPSVFALAKICKILDLSADYILGLKDIFNNEP